MKYQCKLCGAITEHAICDNCLTEKGNKTFKLFLLLEKHFINLLIKDCLCCPIRDSKYCSMLYLCPQNENLEHDLCYNFVKLWLQKK